MVDKAYRYVFQLRDFYIFKLTADLVTFTEETLNGKLHFLRSVTLLIDSNDISLM